MPDHAGNTDLLESLLGAWDEQRTRGCEVPLDQLCRGCPDLLPELERRVRAIRQVEALAGSGAETSDKPAREGAVGGEWGTESFSGSSVLSALGSSFPETRVYLRDENEPGHDSPGSSAPTPPDSPQSPGRYQLVEEVARGGMGAVFKVRDTDLCRDVAVKVLLRAHEGQTGLLVRFVEEAQIGGQLQHPGIVPVYELGAFADGRPYFSMKLVKGQTLSTLLAARADPAQDRPRLLKAFEQVCQTLAYAHSRGVIHRDLKPANVMVGAFGEVQVMDWGLAKVLSPQSGSRSETAQHSNVSVIRTHRAENTERGAGAETQAGSVLGTPAYMPPEQALGEIDRLGERADVFGLGAMLCEILTGRPPYTGTDSAHVLRKAVRGDTAEAFARLDACGADPELVLLARRCLSAEPEDRPRDAGVLARELAGHLESVEGRLRQAELAGAEARARAAEERKRRKLAVALGGAILGLVLVGAGGVYSAAQQRAERERSALAKQADAERQVRDALERAENLRQQARAGNDPAKWAEARSLAERAAALLPELTEGHELTNRVRALGEELAVEEKDRRLLARLDEVWLLRADIDAQSSGFALGKSLREYPPLFAEHGLRVTDTPADASAWVRRRPHQTREALIAGLDAWLGLARQLKSPEAEWLFGALQAADPDEWRRELRAAVARDDAKEVDRLARADALARQAPQTVLLLADYFRPRSQDRAIELLRQAQARFPADFWLNFALADALYTKHFTAFSEPAQFEDAVRFFTTAAALRPDSPHVQSLLGWSLWLRGRSAEGRAILAQLRARRPNYFGGHLYAATMSMLREGESGEEEGFRTALRLQPASGFAHLGLGFGDWGRGRYSEALAEFRRANRVDPFPRSYLAEAGLLGCLGRLDEAASVYRAALAAQPDFPEARLALQLTILIEAGRLDEALTLAHGATVLRPKQQEAHIMLNRVYCIRAQWDDALAAARRAQRIENGLFPVGAIARFASEAEQLRDLEPLLPEFVRGARVPRDAQELTAVICLCWFKRQYYDAAQVYSHALVEPKLAGDVTAERRYDAARYAAMSAGMGDAAKLDEAERIRWRKQAVAWLHADLRDWEKWLESHPSDKPLVRDRLRWWQQDPKFAGLREPNALAKLPPGEQAECRALWAGVADLLAMASRE